MPKHFTGYIFFTISMMILSSHNNLLGEEKKEDGTLVVSEDMTASIFGFGATPPQDSTQKATNTDCNAGNCKTKIEPCTPDVASQYFYFKHIEAKGIGYKKGYSTLSAFLTPYATFSDFLPFADLRGHVFNDGKFAANAGIGVKYLSNHPYVFGIAAYYDYRQVRHTHFNQVSVSLETLAPRWEARVNGYLPVGDKKHTRTRSESVGFNFDHFAGHNLFYSETFFVKQRTEFAMKGADGEFGWHILKPQEDYTLYAGAGPYYYNDEDKHVWGGKVRVEGRITPYLTLEVSDSFDNIFHNIVQGQISINIPFGGKMQKKCAKFKTSCSSALSMEARMMRPMVRQEIIVAHSHRNHFFKTVDPVAISPEGNVLNFQFVNPNVVGPGDGTFENPFKLLADAQAISLPGDFFYVYPGSNVITDPFVMIENQSLLGSSTHQHIPILVNKNQVTLLTVPAQTSNLPTIVNNGMVGGSAIRFNGDNVLVSGFIIVQNDNNNVIDNFFLPTFSYRPIANVTIINNIITQNVSQNGIFLRSISGNNTISNNQFLTIGNNGAGIFIAQEDLTIGNFMVNQNTINAWHSNDAAIVFRLNQGDEGGAQLTVNITNNTLNDNVNSSGLQIRTFGHSSANATIRNNTANNNDGDGILLWSEDESTIKSTVCNNTCLNNGFNGIELAPIENSIMTGVYCNNILNSNSNAGIGFDSPGSQNQVNVFFSALIDGNICNNNNISGIDFRANGSNVGQQHFAITNNTLVGNNGINGYTLFVENAQDSNTCLRFVNNFNSRMHALINDSTSNIFLLEPMIGNEGFVDLIDGRSSTSSNPLFRVVDEGTCAP